MSDLNNIAILDGVTKRYGSTVALDDVSLRIPRGKIIGLLGPNGSGKTTMIKIIAGLLKPTTGEVKIDGFSVGRETKAEVSYLPERPYFSDNMKVMGVVDYFCDFYPDFNRDKALSMLAELNINTKSKLKTLSKGNKEKVQLVLVMSRNAKLYLLDEPIGGVDPAARDYILRTIIGNYNPDSTILISTHLISDIENVLDEFFFIQNGKVFLHSTSDYIRENESKSVDEYFREVFRC